MKKMQLGTLATLAGALALLGPTQSLADPITVGSILSISGSGVVSAVALDWKCTQGGCVDATTGNFAVAGSTGSFAQYNGTFGTIKDINNFAQPLNTNFSLPNFITFALNNEYSIELTFIRLGNETPSPNCIGLADCTPTNPALVTANNPGGLSAFNLNGDNDGTAASFRIRGIVRSHDGNVAPLTGIFTTQFDGLNPAQALQQALAGTELTYSSQMTVRVGAIPEPSQMLLTGFGLVGAALIRKRLPRK